MFNEAELASICDGAPVARPSKPATEEQRAMVVGVFGPPGDAVPPTQSEDGTGPPEEPPEGDGALITVEEPAPEVGSNSGSVAYVEDHADQEFNVADLLADLPPSVAELFPDWRQLFARRPFIRLWADPQTGGSVLALGYAYQTLQDGTVKLDQCQVNGVLFRDLVSVCAPFRKSSDDDTRGVRVVVVPASVGAKLKVWCNVMGPKGDRRDVLNRTYVVETGRLRLVP